MKVVIINIFNIWMEPLYLLPNVKKMKKSENVNTSPVSITPTITIRLPNTRHILDLSSSVIALDNTGKKAFCMIADGVKIKVTKLKAALYSPVSLSVFIKPSIKMLRKLYIVMKKVEDAIGNADFNNFLIKSVSILSLIFPYILINNNSIQNEFISAELAVMTIAVITSELDLTKITKPINERRLVISCLKARNSIFSLP
jgi:hypothetical protein